MKHILLQQRNDVVDAVFCSSPCEQDKAAAYFACLDFLCHIFFVVNRSDMVTVNCILQNELMGFCRAPGLNEVDISLHWYSFVIRSLAGITLVVVSDVSLFFQQKEIFTGSMPTCSDSIVLLSAKWIRCAKAFRIRLVLDEQ